jgi:hypothetical protein
VIGSYEFTAHIKKKSAQLMLKLGSTNLPLQYNTWNNLLAFKKYFVLMIPNGSNRPCLLFEKKNNNNNSLFVFIIHQIFQKTTISELSF